MKVILAPTDLSDSSRTAVVHAANLAKASDAKLILLNAYYLVASPSTIAISRLLEEIQEVRTADLEKLAEELKKETGITEIERIARLAHPHVEIERTAKDFSADLIVMGIKGHSILKEKLIGSTTTSLISDAVWPVLVVPDGVPFKPYRKIVLATDYLPLKKTNHLDLLIEVARSFGAEVSVVSVVTGREHEQGHENGILPEEYMDSFTQDVHFVENEDVISGLNDYLHQSNADLVVTLPREHSYLYHLVHGSITRKMAFHTDIPLLTLPG